MIAISLKQYWDKSRGKSRGLVILANSSSSRLFLHLYQKFQLDSKLAWNSCTSVLQSCKWEG